MFAYYKKRKVCIWLMLPWGYYNVYPVSSSNVGTYISNTLWKAQPPAVKYDVRVELIPIQVLSEQGPNPTLFTLSQMSVVAIGSGVVLSDTFRSQTRLYLNYDCSQLLLMLENWTSGPL